MDPTRLDPVSDGRAEPKPTRRGTSLMMPSTSRAENRPMDINGRSGNTPTAFDHVDEFARFLRDAASNGHSNERPQTLKAWLDLAEAYRITQALRECNGNRSAAARLLGIGRRTLYAKMDKLGITATWRMG